MERICIIPARGGSKRIPRKNIKIFVDKPIIAYSIIAAVESQAFTEVMVSTDDMEIANIAKKYGAKVPFFRSPETSDDHAMTVPVLLEVLDNYSEIGRSFDFVCCLYPTAPFISPQRLRQSIECLIDTNADGVVSVVQYSYPIQRALRIHNNKLQMIWPENYNRRSQDLEATFHDAGQFYSLRVTALKEQKVLFPQNVLPIMLSDIEVQDIDSPSDWVIAELKYKACLNRAGK